MNGDGLSFNRRAVRPLQCLREGWQLATSDYWLLFGITLVAVLIANMGPLYLLMGPCICGLHLCLLRRQQNQIVSFEMLFHGFDYFVPSLVATMCFIVPTLVLVMGSYLALIVSMVLVLVPQGPGGGPPDETRVLLFFGVQATIIGGLFILLIVVEILSYFAYPLIIDRQLSGWEAVCLSVRAGWANFGGLLGVLLLVIGIELMGLLLCFIGFFFVMPISYAIIAVAYRQVFPSRDALADLLREPEPDETPRVTSPGETGIQSLPGESV